MISKQILSDLVASCSLQSAATDPLPTPSEKKEREREQVTHILEVLELFVLKVLRNALFDELKALDRNFDLLGWIEN